MKTKKLLKKCLSITTAVCMILTSVSSAFTDVSPDHWAYDSIEKMVKNNVLAGYQDGTFKPEGNITRAEFATVLVKTLAIENANTAIEFKDVEGFHWAESFIDLANPFLTGYVLNGEYYFKPDEPALREDAAVALVRAKGLINNNVDISILDEFTDKDEISENLKKYIAIAVESGLMNGYPNGTFNPQGHLTRAEVAALFSNLIKKFEEEYEKIAIGDLAENKLPTFKLDESDMTIDLGKNFEKYEFTITGRENAYWYSAAAKRTPVGEVVRDGKIFVSEILDYSWDDSPGISIREKDNEDKGIAKVKLPRYTVNVMKSTGETESHKFIPLQEANFVLKLDRDKEAFSGIISATNIDKKDIKIIEEKVGKNLIYLTLQFEMPHNNVKIKLDIDTIDKIPEISENILPNFLFDDEQLSLKLGEDWEKYQVSYGNTGPGIWYTPILGTVSGSQMPIREDTKIYLEDIPCLYDADYLYVRDKDNLKLGYASFEIPKYQLRVSCSEATISYDRTITPLSDVSVRINFDDGYTFNGWREMTNIDKGDISVQQVSENEIILKFKMPFKDVKIEIDAIATSSPINKYGVVTDQYELSDKKVFEIVTPGVGMAGKGNFKADNDRDYNVENDECFVDYKAHISELKEINWLINLEKFADLRDYEGVSKCLNSSSETKLLIDPSNAVKNNFKLAAVSEYNKLKFNDGNVEVSFGTIRIDEKSLVFDLRNNKTQQVNVKFLMNEFSNGEVFFVIPFANSEANANFEANVLVMLD